jgi:hypothetical protein
MTEHLPPAPTTRPSSTHAVATETRASRPGGGSTVAASGVPAIRARRPRFVAALQRALGAVTAVLLAVDAYVHYHDAGLYDTVTTSTLSQGTLFRAQAAAAVAIAVALLIRPRRVVWAMALLVAASAAAAVLLYTYVDVGALGPLPDMYEPTWALPGKRASAAAETAATLLAATVLVGTLRRRTQHRVHPMLRLPPAR